jgi:long-chain acyl-CoA synthetase
MSADHTPSTVRRSAAEIIVAGQQAALALQNQGITPGDRICISAPNSPELLAVVYGCLQGGIAPAIISASATDRERTEMSSDIQATALLDAAAIQAFVTWPPPSANLEQDPPAPTLPKCRPIHFTSGTSGRPKAVWSGWLPPESAAAWIDEEVRAWQLEPGDVHLVCGPLSHSAPLRFALMTVLAGGSVVIPPRFSAQTAVAELAASDITTTFVAPTHLQRIKELAVPGQHNLRLLAHAGAACPDTVRVWAHTTFGLDVVVEFYGSTEGQFTLCPAPEWITHPGTVGRARAGRAMRVDDDGRLWCKAPTYARFEYWGDPAKTAETWRDTDWYTVGDYGTIDDEGYVYLKGRMGDLIITGGVNVYPAEIERVLMELPGIEHVIAFGLPDPQWGQKVCIAVVGSASEHAISEHLTTNLSGAKRPKEIFRVEELPMTHSGKVLRSAIPALFDGIN